MNKIIFSICIALIYLITSKPIAMAQNHDTNILILIHSDNGGTYELAKEIARGIEKEDHAKAVIKTVKKSENPKLRDLPVAKTEELSNYDGIAFGSPVYFGNISTAMSEFLANTVDLWTQHKLEGMPAMTFMSAGSGAGRELALQSFWNSLAVHGMVLVSNGIRGQAEVEKSIPQGNSVLGSSSLASLNNIERPSKSERYIANVQGHNFANVAKALKGTFAKTPYLGKKDKAIDINARIKEKGIIIPPAPAPVGNYTPYARSGNLVFINQVALKNGKILYPGKVGSNITEEQAKEATLQTMLNVIAVLKEATGGDLNRVKNCVQLTGIFNTQPEYTNHAGLMNPASDIAVEIFGEKGKHARATMGASSLPINSSVEIQAIFEIE